MQSFDPKTIEQNKRLTANMKAIKHKIIVMSGKGGVGKTTVAVNIATELAQRGMKVGILDTDLHGPNIGIMFGVDPNEQLTGKSNTEIDPFPVMKNLSAISLAFTGNAADQPIIWRGPAKTGAIKQFLADVLWGELDYLIIDSPPGTGDEPLTICQLIPEIEGSVIVTTPQEVAVLDSRKSVNFSRQLNIPVKGIVENMSGFACPHCGKTIDLFGKGGGEKAAKEMGVNFLGSIPINPEVTKGGDTGKPIVIANPECDEAKAFQSIVDKIIK